MSFPKSLDVSKAMDKRKDWNALRSLQGAVRAARVAAGISQSEAARRMGMIPRDEALGGGGFMWFETGMRVPTREQWPALKAALSLPDDLDAAFEEAEREVVGQRRDGGGRTVPYLAANHNQGHHFDITAPATDLARKWQGWGTALKPAWEPVIVARKPLVGTVAANVERYGTGAINVDGCRIGTGDRPLIENRADKSLDGDVYGSGHNGSRCAGTTSIGRWPANVALDEEAARLLDEQSGERAGGRFTNGGAGYDDAKRGTVYAGGFRGASTRGMPSLDSGGASRFFYVPKASRSEREAGLEGPEREAPKQGGAPIGRASSIEARGGNIRLRNHHPTVKPVALMRWLVRLVTPPGGLVLDPFAGSGTTGIACVQEGFRFLGIEREAEYAEIARARIAHAAQEAGPGPLFVPPPT